MPRSAGRKPRGFTCIELLCTAMSVSLILTAVLPYVVQSRQEQQRSKCRQNLKQIGLAMHNYHDVYNQFPPGWVNTSIAADTPPAWGWGARLLPFLEEMRLFDQLTIGKESAMGPATGVLRTPVAVFRCPDNRNLPDTNAFRGGYGLSCYVVNYGHRRPPRWSDGRLEAGWPGGLPTRSGNRSASNEEYATGIAALNSNIGIRDITDGTSNTFMVGERSRIGNWAIWTGVGANRFEHDIVADVSFESAINRSATGFSSPHRGGAYVAMADGSVPFLSEDVASSREGDVLQYLGDRHDSKDLREAKPFLEPSN
ncbi:MAG: DUF1559 domain-containing protein [Planctomycetaceae bacterium]|nr:DUF1559 domain-containing protein [Planctomycetaceae bacterium]